MIEGRKLNGRTPLSHEKLDSNQVKGKKPEHPFDEVFKGLAVEALWDVSTAQGGSNGVTQAEIRTMLRSTSRKQETA